MEHTIASISSTIDAVVKDMVTKSDLDEKLRQQFHKTAKSLTKNLESKNNDMIERLELKLSELEKENDNLKTEIDALDSILHRNDQSSSVQGVPDNTWGKLKTGLQGTRNRVTYLLVATVVIYYLTTNGINTGLVLGPLEKFANRFGCQEYGTVKRALGDECMITWSYQGNLHAFVWFYTGICTDWCTGMTEAVFTQSRGGAIENCMQNLYNKLKNIDKVDLSLQKWPIPKCSKCI